MTQINKKATRMIILNKSFLGYSTRKAESQLLSIVIYCNMAAVEMRIKKMQKKTKNVCHL